MSAQVRSAVPPAHLLQRQAHAGSAQLEILTGVDVARPGGLGNAMAGCEIVIHAASPFPKRLVDEREGRRRGATYRLNRVFEVKNPITGEVGGYVGVEARVS